MDVAWQQVSPPCQITRGDLIEKLEHPALFVERETTDEAVRLAADFADGVQVILGGVKRQERRALYFPDKPDLLQFARSGIEAEAINPFTLRASIGSNVHEILIRRMLSGKSHSREGESEPMNSADRVAALRNGRS